LRQALQKEVLRGVYDRSAGRYDRLHALLTLASDRRGREIIVEKAVSTGDRVLDSGAGTGSTALAAAVRAGDSGRVVLFDLSDEMLDVARTKAAQAGLADRLSFRAGDMTALPFEDDSFDAVLSTYSLCPLYDPARGALEMLRVVRPGGKIGIAHSVDPQNALVRWLGGRIEAAAWHFPSISLGCRSVTVLPTLEEAGGRVLFSGRIGVPTWPFLVFVVEKPKT
jgi:ubiquinone/menaquinone biosynthesis C-methylase UbiE